MVVAHTQLIPLQHHEAALFDDQLTKARGQQLLHKIQETYNVQCSLQQADSGLHTSSSVTVNGIKLQVTSLESSHDASFCVTVPLILLAFGSTPVCCF